MRMLLKTVLSVFLTGEAVSLIRVSELERPPPNLKSDLTHIKSDIFRQKWALIKKLLKINRLDIC